MHSHKAWVVTVDMGYGHQRATYPLRDIAYKDIVTANHYPGMPKSDRELWQKSQYWYEAVSRFKQVPMLGERVFSLYDHLQEIENFYPKRDLSAPTLLLKETDRIIRRGWGKHLIHQLNKRNLPLVTSFFTTAHMADIHGYKGPIYCIITDADMSRSWVAVKPKESRIQYFAPTYRVVDRLKLYGVAEERIVLTGFPLPKENSGGAHELQLIKRDLLDRLPNLDTRRRYVEQYHRTLKEQLGAHPKKKSPHPLTVAFAIGGAGAQKEIAWTIMQSLRQAIIDHRLRLVVVAGVRKELKDEYDQNVRDLGLTSLDGIWVQVLYTKDKFSYFEKFNRLLRTTDVLWTKPSELCFYTAMGLPIIMAPAVGSQEKFNKLWMKSLAAGIAQQDPHYANEWLFDWLESGWLAEAAVQGFLEAPKYGTFNIERIIREHPEQIKAVRTVLQY
ncbi:hypothetical protein HZA86_02950 [Candidatus Uhrbacteria bacterium]|nr:hypothetical protein [Candidatus Uhrbacteria bacterium]